MGAASFRALAHWRDPHAARHDAEHEATDDKGVLSYSWTTALLRHLPRADGATLHVRKATRAEPPQQAIYDALGIDPAPGGTRKTVV